jgi:diguanylate cyclase (GGDEF)-like protein/PAS domain S-box-containing protein
MSDDAVPPPDRDNAETLQRALERYQAVLDSSALGSWERHLITGAVDIDTGWMRRLGYDREQVDRSVGFWQSLTHPDDRAKVMASVQAYLQGLTPRYECEYRMRHRDGHWVWVQSRGEVVQRDDEGRPQRLLGTFMDITERRAEQEALARRNALLMALHHTQLAFLDWDAEQGPSADDPCSELLRRLIELTASHNGFLAEVQDVSEHFYTVVPRAVHKLSLGSPEAPVGVRQGRTADDACATTLQALMDAAVYTSRIAGLADDTPPPFSSGMTQGPVAHAATGGDPAPPAAAQPAVSAEPHLQRMVVLPVLSEGHQVVAVVGLGDAATPYQAGQLDFLQPLLLAFGRVVTARRVRAEAERVRRELERASWELTVKSQALAVTLDSVEQGIYKVDADGRVRLVNQRLLELLNLPPELLANAPLHNDVVTWQTQRGDFGPNAAWVMSDEGRAYVKRFDALDPPPLYWRRTRDGRTLEVRTRMADDGGLVRTFSDVSDYLRVQAELRASEERFKSLTSLSSDWFWEQDADFRFTRLDGAGTSGQQPLDGAIGRTLWDLGARNMAASDWAAFQALLGAKQVFRDLEIERTRRDGSAYWVSISGAPTVGERGMLLGYRGVGRDITERKRAERRVERLAFFDQLTGLPNRRLLMDRLQRAMVKSARSHTHGALLFIDLDNFKDLNDTLGHDKGDQLLEQVATRLTAAVRESDTVARFGGDEFVVMLQELGAKPGDAAHEAEAVAQKILAGLNKPYSLAGTAYYSTPSIGVALFEGYQLGVDELLKRADLAMYQAKSAGRNTVRFFDPDMQAAVSERLALEADLRGCIERNELRLVYQVVVNSQGQPMGVEALLRWVHPQRGTVSPAAFVPVAERTGQILEMGQWVLGQACAQLRQWQSDPVRGAWTVAVNVSVRQLRHPEFVAQVVQALAQQGADPQRLKLELTESMLLADVEDTIRKMSQLKAHGVGFALDDFGTGYSSLSYLKRLPLDQVKIDRSFVRDILVDSNDAAIARTILALAHSLDLTVVAEGVEEPGQFHFLRANGCTAFQGYLFGKPCAPEQLPSPEAVRP